MRHIVRDKNLIVNDFLDFKHGNGTVRDVNRRICTFLETKHKLDAAVQNIALVDCIFSYLHHIDEAEKVNENKIFAN